MKFSEQWLREWVDPQIDTDTLSAQLTMAGLEVDAVDAVAGEFSDVVVAEIVGIEQHPDADKLRVCQVATGDGEPVQVVCGAANARQGLKAPLARVGATLPGDFKIKKAKLRGVESRGMLCAGQELGTEEHSDGLLELPADAPVGTPIREYLGLDDQVIELGLTPNRADCLSIRGIARETGVLNQMAVADISAEPVAPLSDAVFPVTIEATQDCPRYVGRVIRNVDISRPTPLWMQEKLRRCGLRSIDPIVDVTNYLLLELGQPMHAFDLNCLQQGIVVRQARAGEKLALLDGQSIELHAGDLVIADHNRPIALAGIMGGQDTAVGEDTRDIFLESAFFAPTPIAGRARRYGLHTDSSHRFERGVDSQLQRAAVERATRLLLDIVGGEPGPVVEQSAEADLPQAPTVTLRRERIGKMLGIELPDNQVEQILTGLGMAVTSTDQGWHVVPPSWRFDIALEVDLMEELARIYGYNKLPVRHVRGDLALQARPEAQTETDAIRRLLVARGFQEVVTYSFVDPALQQLLEPESASVPLKNPISSDMGVMRTSLLAGLLNTTAYNLNRQQPRVRLFETGLRFRPSGEGTEQVPMLAGMVCGRRFPESWAEGGEAVDFYDIKADIEAILGLSCGLEGVNFAPEQHPSYHPGQCAAVSLNGENVGYVGAISPQILKKLDIDQPVFAFEIMLEPISRRPIPKFKELSRFPEVRRDLAIIVDKSVAARQVLDTLRKSAGEGLTNLRLFDIYEGKGIDPQRKSLALGLTFQHSSRTLKEDEVNAAVDQVVASLATDFEATLRN